MCSSQFRKTKGKIFAHLSGEFLLRVDGQQARNYNERKGSNRKRTRNEYQSNGPKAARCHHGAHRRSANQQSNISDSLSRPTKVLGLSREKSSHDLQVFGLVVFQQKKRDGPVQGAYVCCLVGSTTSTQNDFCFQIR